ncbi:GIY-YIG nuclease family protein [Lactococcus kimchii]|uniref:GIY-YIG nuclease family protein n=1 Tax=Lactococcus sp. S-13 TaxID=2507158 RepID=UPI001022EEA1|nr:GIY-YIG nuclease family protein [Lactococcus sp. S-13]RZI49018.1 GIY-YIG nuclease family protein [Lactococcus sp. S-13]
MTILLKDILNFETLLEKYKGKRIKLRFNTNWKYNDIVFDYADMCRMKEDYFIPMMLTAGSKSVSRNAVNDIQFQFIEVEKHRWLFVGAYDIKSRDSLTYHFSANYFKSYAEAVRIQEYDQYAERLIVDFKNRGQSFFYVNPEIINSVQVDSISTEPYFELDINFPGYENLCKSYYDLKQHWNNKLWVQALSEVYGVYLITDKKTGKLYVGSATGQDGIYGRWSAYLADGYDKNEKEDSKYPNTKLKELVSNKGIEYVQKNFQYTVLEIFKKDEIGKGKALKREIYWKEAFQSRKFGYNQN